MKDALSKLWLSVVYLFQMFLAMIFSQLESGFCISSEYFGKMCVKVKPCDEECDMGDELPEVKIDKVE